MTDCLQSLTVKRFAIFLAIIYRYFQGSSGLSVCVLPTFHTPATRLYFHAYSLQFPNSRIKQYLNFFTVLLLVNSGIIYAPLSSGLSTDSIMLIFTYHTTKRWSGVLEVKHCNITEQQNADIMLYVNFKIMTCLHFSKKKKIIVPHFFLIITTGEPGTLLGPPHFFRRCITGKFWGPSYYIN